MPVRRYAVALYGTFTDAVMADTRFEVRLNQRLAQDFDELVAEIGTSRADVFRRAIALYKLAKEAEMSEGHVILRSSEGAERELVSI